MLGSRCALFLVALTGCVRDLPQSDLGDDAVALFKVFDNEPDALVDIVARMDAVLAESDLEASKKQRMFDLPELSVDDLGGADAVQGIDTKDQIRASMIGLSDNGIDDNMTVQVQQNMSCANARSVKCHERLAAEGSDADAFLAMDADVYRTENTIRIETTALDFWIQAPVDFRWVTLDDGRRAVVGRTWIREPFANDGGGRTWNQRFGVDLFVEDPKSAKRTRRYYATWLGPSIDGVGNLFLQPAVRKGLDDGFTRPDAWLEDGGECDIDLRECLSDAPF